MILLLGGTGDTAPLARGLAEAGYEVLVSTATDIPLDVGVHANIQRRSGRLDEEGMAILIREGGIRAIVDTTHPYATVARRTARHVADRLNIPYFTFIRPTGLIDREAVILAGSHEEAARIACSMGEPVLLTTGVKNLDAYVGEARRACVRLVVRVLPERASIEACRDAGIEENCIIAERGPFSVEDNMSVIERYSIGVLVMKDSGPSGGTPEKLEAARIEGCLVVVVRRPEKPTHNSFEELSDLIFAVMARIPI